MFVSKELIYYHIPRTSGTSIKSRLRDKFDGYYLPHHTKLSAVGNELKSVPAFTTVRNPFEWYVSNLHIKGTLPFMSSFINGDLPFLSDYIKHALEFGLDVVPMDMVNEYLYEYGIEAIEHLNNSEITDYMQYYCEADVATIREKDKLIFEMFDY